MHAICHTRKNYSQSLVVLSFWVTFCSWSYVWCLNCLLSAAVTFVLLSVFLTLLSFTIIQPVAKFCFTKCIFSSWNYLKDEGTLAHESCQFLSACREEKFQSLSGCVCFKFSSGLSGFRSTREIINVLSHVPLAEQPKSHHVWTIVRTAALWNQVTSETVPVRGTGTHGCE